MRNGAKWTPWSSGDPAERIPLLWGCLPGVGLFVPEGLSCRILPSQPKICFSLYSPLFLVGSPACRRGLLTGRWKGWLIGAVLEPRGSNHAIRLYWLLLCLLREYCESASDCVYWPGTQGDLLQSNLSLVLEICSVQITRMEDMLFIIGFSYTVFRGLLSLSKKVHWMIFLCLIS